MVPKHTMNMKDRLWRCSSLWKVGGDTCVTRLARAQCNKIYDKVGTPVMVTTDVPEYIVWVRKFVVVLVTSGVDSSLKTVSARTY